MTDLPSGNFSRRRDAIVVTFALGLPTLVTLLYFVLLADYSGGVQQTAYMIGKIIQFGLPVFWVFVVQRSKFQLSRPRLDDLVVNLIFGLLVAAMMLLLYFLWLKPSGYLGPESFAAKAICEKVQGFGLTSLWMYVGLGVFYSLLHSGMEEYYWRWFVFGQLRRLISLRGAIVISGLGFMAHHVLVLGTYFGYGSFATWIFSLSIAVGGGIWAWLYNRSGSLWGVWLGHLLVDAAIFTIGYDVVKHLFTP